MSYTLAQFKNGHVTYLTDANFDHDKPYRLVYTKDKKCGNKLRSWHFLGYPFIPFYKPLNFKSYMGLIDFVKACTLNKAMGFGTTITDYMIVELHHGKYLPVVKGDTGCIGSPNRRQAMIVDHSEESTDVEESEDTGDMVYLIYNKGDDRRTWGWVVTMGSAYATTDRLRRDKDNNPEYYICRMYKSMAIATIEGYVEPDYDNAYRAYYDDNKEYPYSN